MGKIAIVSELEIVPAHSGPAARIAGLMRALEDLGHSVHFVHLAHASEPSSWNLHVAQFGREKTHLLVSRKMFDRLHYLARRIATRVVRRSLRAVGAMQQNYFLLDEKIMPGFGPMIRALSERECFDVVIVEYVYLAKLLDWLPPGVRKVIDTLDVNADRHKKLVSSQEAYRWYSISPKVERAALRRADIVLAIAENEASHFRGELGISTPVYTVSHFVEVLGRIEQSRDPYVSFVGTMSMGNADTLRFFLFSIMPKILELRPDFKLFVAGSICDALHGESNVVALGKVSDVREVFARAPILISPTRIGTGIAIKLLSALACGVPVVATKMGARGHESTGGVVIVKDNDPDAFVSVVLSVIDDYELRDKLAMEAHEAALKWNEIQRESLARAIVV